MMNPQCREHVDESMQDLANPKFYQRFEERYAAAQMGIQVLYIQQVMTAAEYEQYRALMHSAREQYQNHRMNQSQVIA